MSAPPANPEFLLLFRGTGWDKGLSPEDIQQVMNRLMTWFDGLARRGSVKAGQPLGEAGRTVSGRQGRSVADGPFAESREAVAGYLVVQAASLEDAVEIARNYPCLELGASVEVRPVAAECPIRPRVREPLTPATT